MRACGTSFACHPYVKMIMALLLTLLSSSSTTTAFVVRGRPLLLLRRRSSWGHQQHYHSPPTALGRNRVASYSSPSCGGVGRVGFILTPTSAEAHCRRRQQQSQSYRRRDPCSGSNALVFLSSSSSSSSVLFSSSSSSASPPTRAGAGVRRQREGGRGGGGDNAVPRAKNLSLPKSKSSGGSVPAGAGASASSYPIRIVKASSAASSSSNSPSSGGGLLPRVILKRTKQSLAFRNGNPLVFAKAIDSIEIPISSDDEEGGAQHGANDDNEPRLGDLVEVVVPTDSGGGGKGGGRSDGAAKTSYYTSLGFGVYNPNSLYRVRILCHRYLHPDLHQQLSQRNKEDGIEAIVKYHLNVSLQKRIAIGLLSNVSNTNAFRWVNGEGDSLSGLAVELLLLKGDDDEGENAGLVPTRAVAIVMSSAGWCQIHRTAIEEAIIETCRSSGVVVPSSVPSNQVEVIWKTTPSRLVQDGWDETTNSDRADPTAASSAPAAEADTEAIIVRENGIKYRVQPWMDGQKTSVYCDQRENRHMIAQLCRNKRVLDLCCYHGGFALNAIVNGQAHFCTAVDSSQAAVDALQHNVLLNNVDSTKVETVCSDITTFLQDTCHDDPNRQYDVVILDPPKLAPTVSGLDKARRKYHGLNRDAIKVINSQHGGLLLTCTCSAAMTQKDGGQYFLDMVSGAALAANRCVTLLRVTGAASCHTQSPVAYPAGSYLTAALFYVHPAATAT